MFESVKNKKVSQVIIEQIQQMIMSGELKVGDKLPPERELTETLKVGRPALREALKALEVIGFIERRHGQGNFVSNNIKSSFFKPMSLSFKLNNGKIEEIFILRRLLESYTVQEAAKNATEEDIEILLSLYKGMVACENVDEKSEFDKRFHYEIARISNNTLIINLFESVSYLMDSFIDKTVKLSLFEEGSIDLIYQEHKGIIDSIKENNPQKALAYLNKHLDMIDIEVLKNS